MYKCMHYKDICSSSSYIYIYSGACTHIFHAYLHLHLSTFCNFLYIYPVFPIPWVLHDCNFTSTTFHTGTLYRSVTVVVYVNTNLLLAMVRPSQVSLGPG